MKDMIHFVTLFPNCPNYGLVKDVGQIPHSLGMIIPELEAELVSGKIDVKGDYLESVNGLKLTSIPYCVNDFVSGVIYLLKNAKLIDWLNIYHGGRRCYYWTKLYKVLNPNGRVYLKLDLDYKSCSTYRKNKKERIIFEKAVKAADIVSVESGKIKELIADFTDAIINVIPNGYITVDEKRINEAKRENQFITVGRLGTIQKATEILLEAFAQSATKHDWSLKLVGTVDDSFKETIDEYFKKYPELKERVIFAGAVFDRAELYKEYRSARVFVLPSRWEAFPLVGPEALANGCRLILSDVIPPINELTDNLKFGTVVEVESVESLKSALIRETKRTCSESDSTMIQDYARENLMWNSICKKLYKMMQEKI